MLNVSSNFSNISASYSNGSPNSPRSGDLTGWLVGCIYFIIMAAITAPSNGFLLVALFRDPLKCFGSGPMVLIKSITLANFAISVLVEPLFAVIYFNIYMGRYRTSYVQLMVKLAGLISSTLNNASFFTVGILALDHLAAVARPLWYKTKLTKRKRIAYCLATWLYSAGFSLLSLGIPTAVHHKLDLHLNTTTTLILLLASYIALAVCYRVQQKRRPVSSTRAARDKKLFVVICLLVATASIAGIPTAIALHIYQYCKSCHSREFFISFEVMQNMFYLKFAADPFLYAWRLRKYRKSFGIIIIGSSQGFSLTASKNKNKYDFRR